MSNSPLGDLDSVVSVLRRHYCGDGGFLDSLRPYGGSLDRQAMAAIRDAVLEGVKIVEGGEGRVPWELVSLMVRLPQTVRRWAIDPGSQLERNRLILEEDREFLRGWVVEIEDAGLRVLGILEDAERRKRQEGTRNGGTGSDSP